MKLKKWLSNYKNYIALFILAVVICIPLISKYEDVFLDDGIQHIAKMYGAFESILDGQIIPNIMINFCNNFGYSWNIFYGPVSTFFPLIFRVFTNSYIICYKLSLFVGLFLSGFFMYKYVRKITTSENIGLIAGGAYMMMPYHLTDMYIRNAFGEFLSFIFIPIIFLGVYEVLKEKKFSLNLVLGSVFLLLTHNIATICTCIFALIYVLVNFKYLKEKGVIKNFVLSAITILIITSFFWVPLFEHKQATEYHVFVENGMGDMERLLAKRIEIKQLFFSEKEKVYVFEIGIFTILSLFLGIFAFKKIDVNIKKDYITFFILGVFCLIASTNIFPWDKLPDSFKMIQFSWRLLEFSNFFFSVVCAINIVLVIKKFNFLDVISIFCIGIFILVLTCLPYIRMENEELKFDEESAGKLNSNITQTGYNAIGIAKAEYLPEKAYKNMDYILKRDDRILILEGTAKINYEEKNGTKLRANIKLNSGSAVLELPYIYYLGYDAKIDGEIIDVFETENGFVGIKLENGLEGNLEVEYTGTLLNKICIIISFICMAGLIRYWHKTKLKEE